MVPKGKLAVFLLEQLHTWLVKIDSNIVGGVDDIHIKLPHPLDNTREISANDDAITHVDVRDGNVWHELLYNLYKTRHKQA
jgi:hypothetical protein